MGRILGERKVASRAGVAPVPVRETLGPARPSVSAGQRLVLLAGNPVVMGVDLESAGDGITLVAERNGHRALERLFIESFDAAIIDLQLPPFDDFSVVSLWRLQDIPIIAITSKIDASDAIAALDKGADDYLRKPFLKAELRARLRALLRRTARTPLAQEPPEVILVGDLRIDAETFQVWKRGYKISLSVTEFKLLLALVRKAGQVLSREELVQEAWGYEFLGSSRMVDMTIARLRSKVEDHPKQPGYVVTMRGVGYVLQVPGPTSGGSEVHRMAPHDHSF